MHLYAMLHDDIVTGFVASCVYMRVCASLVPRPTMTKAFIAYSINTTTGGSGKQVPIHLFRVSPMFWDADVRDTFDVMHNCVYNVTNKLVLTLSSR